MAKAAAAKTPKSILAGAASDPAALYLLIGETFQTEALARQLVDILVPEEKRSLNLETYDGRTSAMSAILDSARTHGLFGGTKVLWVREPNAFVSGEKRGDITAAMFEAWSKNRKTAASERLLVLAALAGWNQERFTEARWSALSKSEARALLGREVESGEDQALDAMRAHADERGLTVSAYREESAQLEEFLAAGIPADTILIFTASTVDRRKRVFKTVQSYGVVSEFSVARERSGAISAESVEQLVGEFLSRTGKRANAGARRLIARRAGNDPNALLIELEKLCLYVGEESQIIEKDVAASFRDLAESWIFDFTRALAQGQSAAALNLLRGLFEQGEPPLRLLALIARELRMLLVARDCLTHTLAGSWTPRTSFANFRDRLLPMLSEEERGAFGGGHPFAVYLAMQNAARTTTLGLQHALLEIQKVDVALKSTRTDPRLRLEAFVLSLGTSRSS